MPTTSMSGKCFAAARNTMRPMRPNPLMPTLIAMNRSPDLQCVSKSCQSSASISRTMWLAREAEMLEQCLRGRRGAERCHADDVAVARRHSATSRRGRRLRPPGAARRAAAPRRDTTAVLRVEMIVARHRDDAHAHALLGQRLRRVEREPDLGAGRDDARIAACRRDRAPRSRRARCSPPAPRCAARAAAPGA